MKWGLVKVIYLYPYFYLISFPDTIYSFLFQTFFTFLFQTLFTPLFPDAIYTIISQQFLLFYFQTTFIFFFLYIFCSLSFPGNFCFLFSRPFFLPFSRHFFLSFFSRLMTQKVCMYFHLLILFPKPL